MTYKLCDLWVTGEMHFCSTAKSTNPVQGLNVFRSIFFFFFWLHSHLSFFLYLIATVGLISS